MKFNAFCRIVQHLTFFEFFAKTWSENRGHDAARECTGVARELHGSARGLHGSCTGVFCSQKRISSPSQPFDVVLHLFVIFHCFSCNFNFFVKFVFFVKVNLFS